MFQRLFLIVLTVIGGVYAGYDPNLPADANLDRLLLRIAARYGTELPARWFMQPRSYRDLAPFLRLVDSIDQAGRLSLTERRLLKQAEDRYGVNKALLYHTGTVSGRDLHLKVNCHFLGDVRPGWNDSATIGLSGILRPSLAGNLGNLSFYSGIGVWTEYRSDTLFPQSSYQPWEGIAYNLYGRNTGASGVRSSDLPYGGIRYTAGPIDMETAIDKLRSGPSQFFPLTLSGEAPPVTYFRGTLDLDVITYTHIIGALKVQKDKRKYLFMHRLATDLWKKRLHFGINEVIIYGNTTTDEPHSDTDLVAEEYMQDDRGLEWVYCIPFLPFKFVEHYAGDRDNAAVSFDLTLKYPQQWSWYLEFFLDDMLAPWKLLSDDWGNKWGLTVGASYFGQFAGRDLTVQAEYSRVEPWVYTHFSGGSHRYSHFNTGLGSPLGPNSQGAVGRVLLQLNRLNEAGVGINHTAFNRSVRGGKITDIFQQPGPVDSTAYYDAKVKQFLGPGTLWFLQPVLYWNFNVFGRFELHATAAVDLLDNRGTFSGTVYGGLYF
jgi:hypothetical protein